MEVFTINAPLESFKEWLIWHLKCSRLPFSKIEVLPTPDRAGYLVGFMTLDYELLLVRVLEEESGKLQVFLPVSPWNLRLDIRLLVEHIKEGIQVYWLQTKPDKRSKLRADDDKTGEDKKPWEKIPDYNWDRQASKLWWEGYTCSEIGDKIAVSEKTVRNRLTQLRKEYGEENVPTKRQLERRWRDKNKNSG